MNIANFFVTGLHDALEASRWTIPFFVLACMVRAFWIIWVRYVQQAFLLKTDMVLLDVRLPKEIFKSPKAMEIVLGAFYQTSPSDSYGAYWEGKVRAVHSLEIVSREGNIHFYIWVRKALRNVVESQIYAQYPQIEVHEVPDYTSDMPYGAPGTNYEMWGCEYQFLKDDAYPIKTYIEYGLDKDTKPEFVIDPLTSMLEFMGSLGEGENLWFQVVFMAADPFPKRPGATSVKSFKDRGKALIEEISRRKLAKEAQKEGKTLSFADTTLSPGERAVLEAVERNLSKNAFDVGMRAIYIARKDKFNSAHIPGITGLLRPFSSNDLNGFKPRNTTSFDLPWQDPTGVRVIKKKAKLYEEFCKRAYFFYPYVRVPFVMTAEELATIYHFPGQSAETPTLARIESKRGEAPVNLPL